MSGEDDDIDKVSTEVLFLARFGALDRVAGREFCRFLTLEGSSSFDDLSRVLDVFFVGVPFSFLIGSFFFSTCFASEIFSTLSIRTT